MSEVGNSDQLRREIFRALVEAQDRGLSVTQSRREVVQTYGLNLAQVEGIEREGLEKQWPPLSDD